MNPPDAIPTPRRGRWCEAEFEELAESNLNALKRLIQSGSLDRVDLSFAADIFGRFAETESAIDALFPLLEHVSPLVREGAIYGLESHTNHPGAIEKLEHMARMDPSEGVRTAARDVADL